MTNDRFATITGKYPALQIALVGDFCLDRYLEIDPSRGETSIETGLPVHNVVNVRTQPGGAGTILNNLVALGVGRIHPVGFCGEDGEGFELRRELAAKPGVSMTHFLQTNERHTFTYCKPLVIQPGETPRELSRLDIKNWTPTPTALEDQLIKAMRGLAPQMNALIILDQVDKYDTGVVTGRLRGHLNDLSHTLPDLCILADSRRGLREYPPVIFKMNAAELATLTGASLGADLDTIKQRALALARQNNRLVFITLSERGLLGALPDGTLEHVPALPVRGPIDIVGAGDSVTANLVSALAAGATLREALQLANAAASVVVHQLGTTGIATVENLRESMQPYLT